MVTVAISTPALQITRSFLMEMRRATVKQRIQTAIALTVSFALMVIVSSYIHAADQVEIAPIDVAKLESIANETNSAIQSAKEVNGAYIQAKEAVGKALDALTTAKQALGNEAKNTVPTTAPEALYVEGGNKALVLPQTERISVASDYKGPSEVKTSTNGQPVTEAWKNGIAVELCPTMSFIKEIINAAEKPAEVQSFTQHFADNDHWFEVMLDATKTVGDASYNQIIAKLAVYKNHVEAQKMADLALEEMATTHKLDADGMKKMRLNLLYILYTQVEARSTEDKKGASFTKAEIEALVKKTLDEKMNPTQPAQQNTAPLAIAQEAVKPADSPAVAQPIAEQPQVVQPAETEVDDAEAEADDTEEAIPVVTPQAATPAEAPTTEQPQEAKAATTDTDKEEPATTQEPTEAPQPVAAEIAPAPVVAEPSALPTVVTSETTPAEPVVTANEQPTTPVSTEPQETKSDGNSDESAE